MKRIYEVSGLDATISLANDIQNKIGRSVLFAHVTKIGPDTPSYRSLKREPQNFFSRTIVEGKVVEHPPMVSAYTLDALPGAAILAAKRLNELAGFHIVPQLNNPAEPDITLLAHTPQAFYDKNAKLFIVDSKHFQADQQLGHYSDGVELFTHYMYPEGAPGPEEISVLGIGTIALGELGMEIVQAELPGNYFYS